ncbi:MAG: hypothetical protein IPN33_24350 [Saprospiraceae bacterium]|nr:hypothetical protein [Saprospiraceae bacterium]
MWVEPTCITGPFTGSRSESKGLVLRRLESPQAYHTFRKVDPLALFAGMADAQSGHACIVYAAGRIRIVANRPVGPAHANPYLPRLGLSDFEWNLLRGKPVASA